MSDSFSNPYQAPNQVQPGGASAPQRPKAILIFGILNLVFGVLGICGMGGSIASMVLQKKLLASNPEIVADNPAFKFTQAPTFQAFTWIQIVLGFIAVAVLIVAGIGLLTNKNLGRTLSIGYAYFGIASTVIGTIATFVLLVIPMMGEAQQRPEMSMAATMSAVSSLIGAAFGLIYPICLLVFMSRPNVKSWLT